MIAAEHSLVIDTAIDNVWHYVKDIRQWASLFPGCRECEVIDDNNSKWIIKVGAGGLVKTVNVLVTVEQWRGPEAVLFSYQLESEPVVGGGVYRAVAIDKNSTEITLQIKVEGSGQMAPMWEAMSKPLLPQMAKSFAGKLKNSIEEIYGQKTAMSPGPGWLAALRQRLKSFWLRLVGQKIKQ
ncbi:SRPBCC family protein [Halioxenophilus sp. WMMB6]|uniref:CoxG family protein n=1 Tax=Halioxenophilus sp. WMMB6 TaxID=3073815 RepID=UPI00295ECE9F|nr:SRPBCC family protein [Halioxenophilus sp. WMMB6]